MKLLKQFMTKTLRRRSSSPGTSAAVSSSGSSNELSSPCRKRRATLGIIRKKSSMGTCSTNDETSHHSLTSVGSTSEAAWRVEQIRDAPPAETDWWKNQDELTNTEDDTTWPLNSSGASGESVDESIEKKAFDGDSSSGTSSSTKVFHNCGFETWEAARAAWTAKPADDAASRSASVTKQQPVNRKELGKMLSKASSLRTYELPRKMPLKNLVESYVVVWNGDDM
ncbi:expressed unknown protein [Seminavis robusta]|uniref:Uncharacterized protein n=1 Tax=Seminavis robusta TaxID=568900 RepID=A0A9N8HRM8_9STRA|nr:expressed unknown protein [Seminavis robusta]|eukprot:Sro1289_g259700.1 n/a (225) ;mRNA; f:13592-14414